MRSYAFGPACSLTALSTSAYPFCDRYPSASELRIHDSDPPSIESSLVADRLQRRIAGACPITRLVHVDARARQGIWTMGTRLATGQFSACWPSGGGHVLTKASHQLGTGPCRSAKLPKGLESRKRTYTVRDDLAVADEQVGLCQSVVQLLRPR